MIIISILLGLLSLACFAPITIALLDWYWWLMTDQTITSFTYGVARCEGIFVFTAFGFVLFLLMLDAITHIEIKGNNNGDKQTTDNTETPND